MTKFQENCIAQVNILLAGVKDLPQVEFLEKKILVSDFFQEVKNLVRRVFGLVEISYKMREGDQTFFVGEFRYKNNDFKIFVYEDESAIHKNESAYVCDQPDYESETEMVHDFLKQISKALSDDDFQGNCEGASVGDLMSIGFILLLLLIVVGGVAVLFFSGFK